MKCARAIAGCSLVLLMSVQLGCTSLTPQGADSSSMAVSSAQHLLVTVTQDGGRAQPQLGDPGAFYLRRRGYGPEPAVNRTLDQIADDYDLQRVDGWHIASIDQYCEVLEVRSDKSIDELVAELSTDPRIELAQPLNYFETQGVRYDDPLATLQPALSSLAIDAAHEVASGRGVTVAVIDSTVDRRHKEFRGRLNSQLDLVESGGSLRAELHGTAVAGIIGSAANNGAGIVGVAPESMIAPLRACWTVDTNTGRAQCSSFSLAQALESAIRIGADVVNLSLSGPEDLLLAELIDTAVRRGIIVVSAVPAAASVDSNFPSSHKAVIAVESSDSPGLPSAKNMLRAPGTEVMTTVPNDSYAFFSGNSMSAAYVTGVSALMRERQPEISPAEVLKILTETTSDRSINACRALVAAEAATRSC